MSLEEKMNAIAVYWPPGRIDSNGSVVVGDAEEIPCRWERHTQQIMNSEGKMIVSMSRVFVLTVLKERGFLFEGELADAPADPLDSHTAYEIQKFSGISSATDSTEVLYTAFL